MSVPVSSSPGSGFLIFQKPGARTVIHTARASSPLRLLTPKNHGHGAWVYSSTFGGGLVDGDQLDLSVMVEEKATAFLSTQGPTRVYKSERGCRNTFNAVVEADASLIYAPDPISLFESARLTQTSRIELAHQSNLVWVDAVTAGRSARGERWVFSKFDSTLKVLSNGKKLIHERLLLSGGPSSIAERMRRFDAIGTIIFLGPKLCTWCAQLEEAQGKQPLEPNATVLAAISPIEGGALIRIAATSAEAWVNEMKNYLAILPELLGDHPLARRF